MWNVGCVGGGKGWRARRGAKPEKNVLVHVLVHANSSERLSESGKGIRLRVAVKNCV